LNDWKRNIWFYVFQPDEQLRDRMKPVLEKVLDVKY
jgi:hypothetical protein